MIMAFTSAQAHQLIHLQRDDIEFVVLHQCDEIRGDVGPALPEQAVPPVLSEQGKKNTIIKFYINYRDKKKTPMGAQQVHSEHLIVLFVHPKLLFAFLHLSYKQRKHLQSFNLLALNISSSKSSWMNCPRHIEGDPVSPTPPPPDCSQGLWWDAIVLFITLQLSLTPSLCVTVADKGFRKLGG